MGMWRNKSEPTLRLEGQPLSSLATGLVLILWLRNLNTETLTTPGLDSGPEAQHDTKELSSAPGVLGITVCSRTGMPGRSFSTRLPPPLDFGNA